MPHEIGDGIAFAIFTLSSLPDRWSELMKRGATDSIKGELCNRMINDIRGLLVVLELAMFSPTKHMSVWIKGYNQRHLN